MYELIEIARGKSSFCLDILRTRFYSGKVKIVNTLEDDAENIEKGDIVVSKIDRLNPDWVPIMKMAGAIILDGGLPEPSNQSIVCRELRTPYISQVGNATSVLHNDEEYLIDCETGIIYKVCLLRKKRLLFVCTGNVDRSPTAEHLFDDVEGVEAKSAGTSIAATLPLTKQLLKWADLVFVMEHEHQKAALAIAPDCWKKIEVLDVPDDYYNGQPELKTLLKTKLQKFVPEL